MKFLKNLNQKKLAKAVAFCLLVSGGMFVGMGQAYAIESKAWISGAEKQANGDWYGKAGTEVRITAEEHSNAKKYDRGNIYGDRDKNGGKVIVEDAFLFGTIYGGGKDKNTVNISGGVFYGHIYGGDGFYGGNTTTINGGTFFSNIYATDEDDIYFGKGHEPSKINLIGEGGRLKVGGTYVENKNPIEIQGAVYGSAHGGPISSFVPGNILNVAGKNITVRQGLKQLKEINFYINNTVRNGDTLLTTHDTVDLDNVHVGAGVENGSDLGVGDKVTLIKSSGGITGRFYAEGLSLSANDFQAYGLEMKVEDRDKELNAIITSGPKPRVDADSPVKSPVETQAAGLTMLTTGADMLAGQGFDNAASAVASDVNAGGSANTMTPFVTVGGAKTRVNSGSHIDVNGWHLNVGLAKEIDNKAGKLLIGPVVEYGKGSYDSYLDNGFHGEGDTRYIGGGVMAKQTNDNGFYYEGSLRAGKLSNDYKSQENSSNKYDTDSTYYAAHVGLGKILKLNGKNTLDYYGKYFYTHQKGNDATLYADDTPISMHFDGVDSSRTRLGARFTHALSEKNSVYAGLAWQHEFSGTARATMDAYGTPAPSVKGNTGIMELGWKVEAGKKLDLDLNATGYTGKQKGASLNLAVNFKF